MTRSSTAGLFVFALLGALAPALADSDDKDIPPQKETAGVDLRSPAVIKKGKEILSGTCGGYCHGSEGKGFKGPSLRNRADLSPDDLHATISFGRKRGGNQMPAWSGVLSEEDIWTVIAAIVSLRHADPGGSPQAQPTGH